MAACRPLDHRAGRAGGDVQEDRHQQAQGVYHVAGGYHAYPVRPKDEHVPAADGVLRLGEPGGVPGGHDKEQLSIT